MKAVGLLHAVVVLAALCGPYASAQSSQERDVLARFDALRASASGQSQEGRWVQPTNQTENCELYMWGDQDPAADFRWLGDCLHGRASGVGLIVAKSPQRKSVTLEEYGTTAAEVVSYRQVLVSEHNRVILKGRSSPDMHAMEVLFIGRSPKGNVAVVSGQEYCRDGECVRLRIDPLSGSTTHEVAGYSYTISWLEQRAENAPLFSRRGLMLDGTMPVEKHILDGGVYDFYRDLHSGQVVRVEFSDAINRVLALPMERYASVKSEVDAAVMDANSKFAGVFERYCKSPTDPDVRIFCDPASLLPSEAALTDARAELNEMGRTTYAENQRTAAAYSSHATQASMDQARQMQARALSAEQRQAQAVAAEEQRLAGQDALRRGIESINQAGQAAQRAGQQLQQSYGTPQVQPLTPHQTGVVHCRTIGYITTCN